MQHRLRDIQKTHPKAFRPVAVLAAGVMLVACQIGKPGLSLEEAKQITTTFVGTSFTPPPRTIKDITAILDDQPIADPLIAAEARRIANQEVPKEGFSADLAEAYRSRARAAKQIGRTKQEIDDLKMAALVAMSAGSEETAKILFLLGHAQILGGRFSDGLRDMEKSARYPKQGRRIFVYAMVAKLRAFSGDFEGADEALRQAKDLHSLSARWKRLTPRARTGFKAILSEAEGAILRSKGMDRKAETFNRKTIAILAADDKWRESPWIYRRMGALADTLRRHGRLAEAESEVRKALLGILRRVGRYSNDTALQTRKLANILNEQGRHEEAASLARAAVDIYEKTGSSSESLLLGRARASLAYSLAARSRWQEALAVLEVTRAGLAGDPETYNRFFRRSVTWPLALIKTGRAEEAIPFLEGVLERVTKRLGEKHYGVAERRGILAMALATTGDKRQAMTNFTKALPILVSRSRQSDDGETTGIWRQQRLKMILEAYIDLLVDIRDSALERELEIAAVSEAFKVADFARGQSVQRALAAAGARAAAHDPDLADLARREQDAQKQISALYGLLAEVLNAPTDQQNVGAVQSLRLRIDRLREARGALVAEIKQRFPEYFNLINPPSGTIEDARVLLRQGEALISTYAGEDRTYVWAFRKAGEVAFAVVDVGRQDLADTVGLLRAALEPNAATLGDIPRFDTTVAYDLYQKLFKPVKAGWKDANSLLVVARGPLGYLPLSVLPTESATREPEKGALFSNYKEIPWLARTHAVTLLPSVASLRTLRGLPPGPARRTAFVGFGDPWFSRQQAAKAQSPADKGTEMAALSGQGVKTRGLPVRLRAAPATATLDSAELAQLPRLPDTADEIKSIDLALKADPVQSVFLGKEANEQRVKTMKLSSIKVLAFATHGLMPGDLDGLTQPALALSSPTVVGGKEDGLLTMGEILGLKLNADWVVLSACNTGAGEGAGAEAVSGLGRAFFYAGTRALLVSNWPVETTSAKALITDLFRRQSADPALSRAEALRQSMLALIDGDGYVDPKSDKTVFSYAHPLFWAPFSLIGDGGKTKPGV